MWLQGRMPQQYRRPQVEEVLGFLERELQRKVSRLPLPLGVRLGDRLERIREIRKHYDS